MAKTMETISQQSLYRDLDEILNRVSEKQIPALVIREDQPIAVIFPYEIYQQWVAAREQRLHQARQGLQAWTSEHAEVLNGLDLCKLLEANRDNRTE